MPTQLEVAIQQLQADVDSYQQGTKNQPADDTTEWYLLRSKALGLTYLKQLQVQGLDGRARQCEQLYTKAGQHFKGVKLDQVAALLTARDAV